MERTEEQILSKEGITVVLGGREYDIAPLVIRDSRPWRKKVAGLLSAVPKLINTTADTPDEFVAAMDSILVGMPEEVTDLFFEYAKELDRDDIEGIATDDELAEGFKKMIEVTFPLAESIPAVMKRATRSQ